MSQEILEKLAELKGGQDDIAERLGRLESRFGGLESKVGGLESKVDTISQELLQHRQNSSDNFETVLSAIKAIAQNVDSGGNSPTRIAGAR